MSACDALFACGARRRAARLRKPPPPRRAPIRSDSSRARAWTLAALGAALLGLLLLSAVEALDDLAGAVHLLA